MSETLDSGAAWWKSAVVYQIYPRSFADADGDGIGDLRGIIDHLDHVAGLGVDVVWLSPVYRSPQDDNGYDISDYRDVDPVFGTMADLDELIVAVHDRGMKLVMDLVVNHTSDEHPWFVASRSSVSDPKRDWYWWRAGRDGGPPNNWTSIFSGPAWEHDPHTDEWYLHLFSRKQPDLNWETPAMRKAVYEMMRWWLDRGIDGFRMDVVNLISKQPDLPDGRTRSGVDALVGGEHYFHGPRVHEYLQEMHREVYADRRGELLLVGEMPGATVDQARLYTDPSRGEVDMIFQFEHMGVDHGATKWDLRPFDLRRLKASFARWQEGLAEVGWNSLYWSNHDQPRVVSRFGDDEHHWYESATLLATVLHLQRGTPYVYQGEELGMTNAPFATIADVDDIEARNHHRLAVAAGQPEAEVMAAVRAMGRDNARTPMQWDAGPQAGFTTGTPWIAVNPNHVRINAAAQVGDERSVYHHYRRLIELRHTDPVVVHGDMTMLAADDEHLFAFVRAWQGSELLVAANVGPEPLELPVEIDGWVGTDLVLGNHVDATASSRWLRPWEVRVHRRHDG